MKKSDRLKRAIALYLACAAFVILLPIVLSYSLGYHIDFNAFRIYKTGIIYINSHPTGASIYINGKKHSNLTPAQIEELKPGTYRVEVKREGFYPWEKDIVVRPNMVTKADKIILFPIAKEMRRISERAVSDFFISDKGYIYYMARFGLYRSNLDGSGLKRLSAHSDWPERIIGKKLSPAGDKFLYFDERRTWVVYLNLEKALAQYGESAQTEEILKAEAPIVDVYWYSGGGYIIVVTEKYINVVELRGGPPRNIVSLHKFNAVPRSVYYDADNGSLYFADTKSEGDSKSEGLYLYRLDLRQTFFDYLMQFLLKKEVAGDAED